MPQLPETRASEAPRSHSRDVLENGTQRSGTPHRPALRDWCGGKWVLRFLFIFSVLGFIDAAYLTAEHYLGRIPPCSLTGGCELVLTSTYAAMFGVPVALLGALYYFGIFVLLFFFRETGDRKFLKILFASSIAGLLFSGWFVYIQLFVLHAICLYCMGSAVTSTLIFLGSLWLFISRRHVVEN